MKSLKNSTYGQKVLEILCLFGMIFTLVYLLAQWPGLPETVPKYTTLGDSGIENTPKLTLFLIPGADLLMYIVITVYCMKPDKWQIPINMTDRNRKIVNSRYYDLMLSIKLLIVLGFGAVSWFDLNAINHIATPSWLVYGIIITVIADIIIMFLRMNKAAEDNK